MKLVADASALLAVLLGEADAETHVAKLLTASVVLISAINWWEVLVRVRSQYGDPGEASAGIWMKKMGIVVEPVTARHAELALAAHTRYKSRPARLNMGDCFAYALARASDAPLLYKGNDFTGTDLRSA